MAYLDPTAGKAREAANVTTADADDAKRYGVAKAKTPKTPAKSGAKKKSS